MTEAAATVPEATEVVEKEMKEEVAETIPPQLAVINKKHPLEHSWCFWYDQRGGGKGAAANNGRRMKGEKRNWENNLKLVGDFATVEDFWSYFNNMRRPSGLEFNANYHIFKSGIKPMWEDPQNAKGGKWILQLKGAQKEKLNEYWETIVLSIIGEMLEPEENGNEICGAVMSKRKTGDRIAVWNRTNKKPEVIMAVGRQIRDALSTPNVKVKLSYQVHEDSLKTGASYTNPAKYVLDDNNK